MPHSCRPEELWYDLCTAAAKMQHAHLTAAARMEHTEDTPYGLVLPSPAIHAVLRRLNAGETVCQRLSMRETVFCTH